jgi:hypothetical protein
MDLLGIIVGGVFVAVLILSLAAVIDILFRRPGRRRQGRLSSKDTVLCSRPVRSLLNRVCMMQRASSDASTQRLKERKHERSADAGKG